jgi:TRAP transporter 4TM/12TM fusion protein
MLVLGYTPFLAAFLAIIFVPIVSLARRETWMGPRSLGQAIQIGVRNALPIVSACATAGIIMAVILITGVGFKFVDLVLSVSRDVLLFGLILTAIASLILGMGLPTTGAYILVAALAAPALVKMGLSPLSSHLFVFYFAIISAITPPVALAAYAGASIAGSNMIQTGVTASRLGLAAFILPFYFVYNPAILLEGSWYMTARVLLLSMLALYLLSGGIEGWASRRLNPPMRGFYLLAGFLLIYPHFALDIIGIILGPALLAYTWLQNRRGKDTPL